AGRRPVRGYAGGVGVVAIEGVDAGASLDERFGGLVLPPPARPVERCGLVEPALCVGIGTCGNEPPDLLRVVAAGGIAQEVRVYGGSAPSAPLGGGAGGAVLLCHQCLVPARPAQERRHGVSPVALRIAAAGAPAVGTRG